VDFQCLIELQKQKEKYQLTFKKLFSNTNNIDTSKIKLLNPSIATISGGDRFKSTALSVF
jgi:hypothetical protein